MTQQKTGVIDVGGGLRGIYACGVFDRCMEEDIVFDVAIGISAGSANISSYMAKQPRRNFVFYTEYAMRPEYMSMKNFITKGSYIDLDYVYSTLTNEGGEYPVDYDTLAATPTDWRIEATHAITGEPRYFDRTNMARNSYDILKASSAIPFVCKPYWIDGEPYFDGALGDTVPIEKAFEMGCTKVVLVLTKPADVPRQPGKDLAIARLIEHKYPAAAERIRRRADRYNEGVALAKALEEDGHVLVVAPDDTCGVDTLTKDSHALEQLYAKGYADGAAIAPFLAEA